MEYIERAKKFRTKKRLGQNFLVDENIIETISDLVESDDAVLEIGPGIGFVTEEIIKKAKYLRAVELDEEAIEV
jgi:16S rRNA (adenine1518-N6/adenine1519-N6)-dimethyltransferase